MDSSLSSYRCNKLQLQVSALTIRGQSWLERLIRRLQHRSANLISPPVSPHACSATRGQRSLSGRVDREPHKCCRLERRGCPTEPRAYTAMTYLQCGGELAVTLWCAHGRVKPECDFQWRSSSGKRHTSI